jgi:hypothetical protein
MTTVIPGLMMPAFSNAIATERVAEMLLMIEVDGRDRSGHRRDHIRGIEAAAQANLNHADLHARAAKELECRGRRRFEERRMDGQRAGRPQPVGAREHVLHGRLEQRRVDGAIVDDESFGQVAQVRGCISAGPHSGGEQRCMRHRRHRSLTVRACDVQRAECALRDGRAPRRVARCSRGPA